LNYDFFSGISVPAATVSAQYIYRLNDTYDPDYTGTGHQPMYRDQLFALYSNCVVWKTEAHTTIAATTTNPLYVNGVISRSSSGTSDISVAAERGEASEIKVVSLARPVRISATADIAERFGVTRSQLLADDLYSQGSGATPSNVIYYIFSIVDPTGTGTTAYANTKLTMQVRFRRLLDVGSS